MFGLVTRGLGSEDALVVRGLAPEDVAAAVEAVIAEEARFSRKTGIGASTRKKLEAEQRRKQLVETVVRVRLLDINGTQPVQSIVGEARKTHDVSVFKHLYVSVLNDVSASLKNIKLIAEIKKKS